MEATTFSPSHRHQRLVVLAVGGLSLVTAALYLWAMQAVGAGTSGGATMPTLVVFALVNAAAAGLLWWYRHYPVRVFAAVLGVYVVSALATGVMSNGGLTLPLWFSVFAVAAYAPLVRAGVAIAIGWVAGTVVKVSLALAAGVAVTAPEVALVFTADVGFFYLACGALGLGFRFQRQRASEAAEHARLIEERSRARHAEAVATERNRLARDLHDLAAHELMDVLLHLRALQITSDDPTLPEIEQKTSRALENMRTVVRTLRQDDDHAEPDRLPLADATTQVIEALRAERDLAVNATVNVAAVLDDAVTSTVLSVLTETMLNAARHAPGLPVTVVLDADASSVELTVTNPVASSHTASEEGTGYGLIGAAERAGLLGGNFVAGRRAHGEWIATLTLPAEPALTQFAEEES